MPTVIIKNSPNILMQTVTNNCWRIIPTVININRQHIIKLSIDANTYYCDRWQKFLRRRVNFNRRLIGVGKAQFSRSENYLLE